MAASYSARKFEFPLDSYVRVISLKRPDCVVDSTEIQVGDILKVIAYNRFSDTLLYARKVGTAEKIDLHATQVEAVRDNDEENIAWAEGQTVWDVSIREPGIVTSVNNFAVAVNFADCEYMVTRIYNRDGSPRGMHEAGFGNRVLFFSKPFVAADRVPALVPFTPTIEAGTCLIAEVNPETNTKKRSLHCELLWVKEELEDRIICNQEQEYLKSEWLFRVTTSDHIEFE